MFKEPKYGWYLPDNEERMISLLDNCRFSMPGTQGSGQRHLAMACANGNNAVIDIGGHIGCWSKDFVNHFNKTIIFEPIYEHYECLLKNLEKVPKEKYNAFNIGIGDKNETAKIFHANFNTGQSRVINSDNKLFNYDTCKKDFIESALSYNNWGGTEKAIELMRLDSFFEKNNHLNTRINLIKIDVEGYELNVLSGACEIISNNMPILIIEILDGGKFEDGKKVFKFLKNKLNYSQVTNIGPIKRKSALSRWNKRQKDFIFCHNSMLKESCKKYDNFFKYSAGNFGF